jgi:hypothetical protein
MAIVYTSRESVKTALDEAETARSNAQIDDAIAQGARDVEGLCNRPENAFAPVSVTRTYDWPGRGSRAPSWVLRFDNGRTMIDIETVTTNNGATTLTAGQWFATPTDGPPYTGLEIDLGGSGSLGSLTTSQRAIGVTGLEGWSYDLTAVGSLAGTLAASATAQAELTWTTARFGVGDVLLIDDERMVITERSFVDTTQQLGADLDASEADVSVTVADGTAFAVDEIISIDGERMRVIDIIGDTLTVKRAQDGSQLAAHAGTTADIYALAGVELDRAQLGTALAAHDTAATVYRWRPPALLAALNRAYALNTLLQERSGYARVAGTGENAREFTGRGVAQLEKDVFRIFGRKARHLAIA